ncbi:hypothetical protein GGX14DRAFT_433907, partial [Mycena pura]
ELTARRIHFTGTALRHMSTLADLRVIGCEIAAGEHLESESHASILTWTTLCIEHRSANEDALKLWVLLPHPEHLRDLRLICHRLRSDILQAIPHFPCVHRLSIEIDSCTVNQALAFLSKFRNVETLEIRVHVDQLGLDDASAPSPGPPGDHFTFCDVPVSRECRAQSIGGRKYMGVLSSTGEARSRNQATLHRGLQPGTFHSFRFLYCQVFTCTQSTRFFEALPHIPALPGTLEHLGVDIVHPIPNAAAMHKKFEYMPVRDALVARFPALVSLRLHQRNFHLYWQKSADGTVNEQIILDWRVAFIEDDWHLYSWYYDRRAGMHHRGPG